jgi:hypothetical protein
MSVGLGLLGVAFADAPMMDQQAVCAQEAVAEPVVHLEQASFAAHPKDQCNPCE